MHLGMSGLQWIMNGYMLPLSALILFGGALGDRVSHAKIFGIGLIGFAFSSLGCALAPNLPILVATRVLQGFAGALVVPNSLAMLESAYTGKARGIAIGQWAAWSGISTAIGPLAGGWLVDAASWRFVFLSIIPFSAIAAWIVITRHVAARRSSEGALDYLGAALITLGLTGAIAALIIAPDRGFTDPLVLSLAVAGVIFIAAFIAVEAKVKNPLLPLDAFRSRQFVGANLNTVFVYAALSGLFFLLMLEMQNRMQYSAMKAGASLLPVNVMLLVLSPISGRISSKIGARLPMAIGSILAGAGALLFSGMGSHSAYLTKLFPAIVVFGLGLGILVAPLTSAALQSLGEKRAGIASGVNNAVARLAGLLATAAIPLAVGIGGSREPAGAVLDSAFSRAMLIVAVLCAAGAVAGFVLVPGKSAKAGAS